MTRARLIALVAGLLAVAAVAVLAAPRSAKRVLIVHSFGSTAPPFTTHSTAFETALVNEFGAPVDLDQVSLDMARYAQRDMQEAFVDFLKHRLIQWQPDLVVTIGSPAGRFVGEFRRQLFPNTPVLYSGMDRRLLTAEALADNAAFVGMQNDIPGMLDDMLQLMPDMTNLFVVIGASPLEQYWADAIRRTIEQHTSRVSVVVLNDLSFDQVLERVATLPPRSFLFMPLFIRDASGVTHNGDAALQRLHAAANAPLYGLWRHQLGLGIIGGRLYEAEMMGVESARIAVRILRGEPAANFPVEIITPGRPRYDWRELQRWGISEAQLPADSVVLFREPSVWEQYRWHVLGVLALGAVETGLIVGLLVNLKHRRHVERLLRESQQQFERVVENIHDAVVVEDRDGRVVFANDRFLQVFGLTREQVGTMRGEQRAAPEHQSLLLERRVQCLGGEPVPPRCEYAGRRSDGRRMWVEEDTVVLRDPQGRVTGTQSTIGDITARRESEEELQRLRLQAWHADRVARTGALTSSLAHELNQPLAAILSNAQAALRFLAGDKPDLNEIREILGDIVADDKRAGAVISGLRAMLRRQESHREFVPLRDVIQETLDLLHGELVSQQVEAHLQVEADRAVWADKAQVQQVILNLVLNAAEAMQDQPLDRRRIEIRVGPGESEQVQVSVRDTGPGIDAEHTERLFEAFWTSKAKGLGVGLPICRSIIEAHGGRIWLANSAPGQTTFRFTLPTLSPQNSAQPVKLRSS